VQSESGSQAFIKKKLIRLWAQSPVAELRNYEFAVGLIWVLLFVVPYPNNDRNPKSKTNEEMTLWFVLNFLVSGSGIAKNTHGRARNPSVGCIYTNSNLLLAES
jgi:hypothetical protein